jgi:tRNA A-37 threonylcarbamoyl transferase component Bud32
MGLVDRWIKKFIGADDNAGDDSASTSSSTTTTTSSPSRTSLPEQPTLAVVDDADPLDAHIAKARARLTVDREGRRYAESPDFLAELSSLDGGGRRKAADELLADALLCSPSLSLRRRLAERLLHRGERQRARGLLDKLAETDAHATFALTALGEIADAEGAFDDALHFYERVLAIDITLQQPKARARRLRTSMERAQPKDGRAALARFLGTRAAGARYAVVDEVGRGGAATVFRARDRTVGRDVALKIFHPRGNREERRRRLIEEARIAGAFDHPHVVPVLDLDDERDLLVMMLCDGGSLQRAVQRQGKLGARVAVEHGAVLLRTLADIHDAGHLHLDVKPSNLLLHEGRLLICDFGTAGLKELGAAAGTRAYMAPEQLRSSTSARAPADLYAAGLVIAEMMEGRLARGGVVSLPSLTPGPRRRALERVLSALTAEAPEARPGDGRLAAQQLLEAGAFPKSDDEGGQLAAHVERLARQAGDDASARLAQHPLISALRPDV